MNYQQAIAAATKQIRCRSAAAAAVTTAEITGSGFLSFFPAVADAATDFSTTADVAAVVTTTADAETGSGFSSFFSAVADAATTADADAAANALIYGGPYIRALIHCNNGH